MLRKAAKRQAFSNANKTKYPGGPGAEKQRLLNLLRGANRSNIQEFAKAYGSSGEYAERNWLDHPGGSSKAKPGDMVFETNDIYRPLVYIGSYRTPSDSASIRLCFDRNGILVKRTLFERWDANDELTQSRLAAIEEWE